jgi:hypothetical protein
VLASCLVLTARNATNSCTQHGTRVRNPSPESRPHASSARK